MTLQSVLSAPLRAVNARFDTALTRPEANAAGRMGLFRIGYSLFYLWHLSSQFAERQSGLPEMHRLPLIVYKLIPVDISPAGLRVIESLLVTALFLLLFGIGVRYSTLVVLCLGFVLEVVYMSSDPEHAEVFLTFTIPFFVVLAGTSWGETYSIDRLLRQHRGRPVADHADDSWRYFLPARACLVILSVLFLFGALLKMEGTWLDHPSFISNLMLEQNVYSALVGLPQNRLAPYIFEHTWIGEILRYGTLLFEGLFFTALFSNRTRNLMVSVALVFHSINALFLAVTFTPVMVLYGLFIDWQAVLNAVNRRFRAGQSSGRLRAARGVGASWAAAGAFLAALSGLSWNTRASPRAVLNLWGSVTLRTIWWPVLPMAGLSVALAAWRLVRLRTNDTSP